MPSKLNDHSDGTEANPDGTDPNISEQQQHHDDQHTSEDDRKPAAKPTTTTTTTKKFKLKDLTKDEFSAFLKQMAVDPIDATAKHGDTSSDAGVQDMYNEFDNPPEQQYDEDEAYKYYKEWTEYKNLQTSQPNTSAPPFVNIPSGTSVMSAPAATFPGGPNFGGGIGLSGIPRSTTHGGYPMAGRVGGGFGRGGGGLGRRGWGQTFGVVGAPPPRPHVPPPVPIPTYVVKGSNMGLRLVPRDIGDQESARLQLSRYERGTGTALVKNIEQATKPLSPLIAPTNYSKLVSTTFDSSTIIAQDVHLWQESIRQIHDRATTFDMLAIFKIPNVFDTITADSVDKSTHLIDAIKDFNNPSLTDDIYFNWQHYTRKFGSDVEFQSDIWMCKFLKSSLEPSLYTAVMLEYERKPIQQQGSITLFRLIANRMVLQSYEARRHLLRFIEEFDIRRYPGEDVSLACVRIKEVCTALGDTNLPTDLLSRVLEGFEKSTTEAFRQMCSTLRISFLSSFTRSMLGSLSPHDQLTNLLRDLESAYLDLKAGGKWIGAGSEGAQANASVFNVAMSSDDQEHFEEYAIYKASTPANRLLPFKEWVKTATCRYCNRVGHIRPDCNRRKADLRNGIDAQRSPASTTRPSPAPSSDTTSPPIAKPSTLARLRDHPQFKALKAAFDMFDSSDGEISNEAHAAIMEEDVTDLMCALGLKE